MSLNNPGKSSVQELVQPAAYQLNTAAPSTLSSPPTLQVHWEDGEYANATPVPTAYVISFNVPSNLPSRKLYGSIWSNTGTPLENWFKARIDFWLNNSPVGSLPWGGGASAALLNRALPSLVNGGGYVDQDSLILTLDAPAAGWLVSPAILQPQCFKGVFDRVTVSITELQAITAIRVYLGCLSYVD